MIISENYKIGIRDITENVEVRNKSILGFLEEIGCKHSDKAGYGVLDIKGNKLVWVLLDWKLEVIKRPKYGQTITINTWSKDAKKCYCYRDFEILDEEGNLIGKATSKWVLIDIEKNKITKVTEEVLKAYEPEYTKSVFDEEELNKIAENEKIQKTAEYLVRRIDIDVNKHMHNLNYLNVAYEALPEDIYEKGEFNNVRITYKKEAKLGDNIKTYYSNENGKIQIVMKDDEEASTYCIIELF